MSYRRILGTTLVLGGTSIVNTLIRMVRTKALALMLGPYGVGLIGIYGTVTGLYGTVTGMGIGESGVRQVAGAVATGDDIKIAKTVIAVRRSARISGVVGCLLLILFSGMTSRITFGTSEHAFDLTLLSLTLLIGSISAGQSALIQGARRIGDLAKLSVIEAILAVVFSIPIIYFYRERGIPFYILAVSAMTILSTWWYARKIKIPAVKVSWPDFVSEVRPLLKLGSGLMAGVLVISFTQYVLRVLIVKDFGLIATGIYQASTSICLVYVGIILNAMLTDFYPRLSAAADNDKKCALLINQQIEVGLLLAVPGILAVMTGAPYLIPILYSSKFALAVEVLRWQILGVMLQVVSWPIGFILRAKGEGRLFFWTEVFAGAALLFFAWLGMKRFGLPGAGAALFAMNVCYFVLIFVLARRRYGFRFTRTTARLFGFFSLAIALVSATHLFLPHFTDLLFKILVTLIVGICSLYLLVKRTRQERSLQIAPKSTFV